MGKETGWITSTCAECGAEFKVLVTFPAYNQGFEDQITSCPFCDTLLTVYDEHQYNEDGKILN